MQTFTPDMLPILGEYVFRGVTLCLSQILTDKDKVTEFIQIVKEACLEQGFSEERINNALTELESALKDMAGHKF